MWKFVRLEPSDLATKKWRITFQDSDSRKFKTVNFGGKGYRDYTLIEDKREADLTRDKYRTRHAGDNIDDPFSPGALSWWILWGDSRNIRINLRKYLEKFGL